LGHHHHGRPKEPPAAAPPPRPEEAPQQPPQAGQQAEVVLNDKDAHAAYSNFARVTATPEEVIIDFGLNPNPFHSGRQEVNVSQRLIMNFYTAKRDRKSTRLNSSH